MSKQQDTKNRILDVAQDLIQKRGLNAMSFQDLSDQVGIRKASVHYHFAQKSDMVNALLKRYLIDFESQLKHIGIDRSNAKSKLKQYFAIFEQTLLCGNNCLFGVLMAENNSLDAEGNSLICRFLQMNVDWLSQVIQEGTKDGSFTQVKNSRVVAQTLLSTIEGSLLFSRCQGQPKRMTEVVAQLVDWLTATR